MADDRKYLDLGTVIDTPGRDPLTEEEVMAIAHSEIVQQEADRNSVPIDTGHTPPSPPSTVPGMKTLTLLEAGKQPQGQLQQDLSGWGVKPPKIIDEIEPVPETRVTNDDGIISTVKGVLGDIRGIPSGLTLEQQEALKKVPTGIKAAAVRGISGIGSTIGGGAAGAKSFLSRGIVDERVLLPDGGAVTGSEVEDDIKQRTTEVTAARAALEKEIKDIENSSDDILRLRNEVIDLEHDLNRERKILRGINQSTNPEEYKTQDAKVSDIEKKLAGTSTTFNTKKNYVENSKVHINARERALAASQKNLQSAKLTRAKYNEMLMKKKMGGGGPGGGGGVRSIMKDIGSGAQDVFGDSRTKIGFPDDFFKAPYTSSQMSTNLSTIVGQVKTNPNYDVRTRVGDRGFVESLVNVKQNRSVSPFGSSGTVGEANLGERFDMTTPAKQIGIGDVTARPGYRLSIEDIRRRKKQLKLKVKRGEPKKNIVKRGTPGVIPVTKTIKVSPVANIRQGNLGGAIQYKGAIGSLIKGISTVNTSGKLNGVVKLGKSSGALATFSIKGLEESLNKQSRYVKRRKKLKVKL